MTLSRAVLIPLGLVFSVWINFLAPAAVADELETVFAVNTPQSQIEINHDAWDRFLRLYVVPRADGVNLVKYSGVAKADATALKAYIASLQSVKVSALNRDEQRAFWTNLYNAVTVDVVLDHYPVASIRDISLGGGFFASGPWSKALVTVEGRKLSLDNIEHDILRKVWGDPLVHYSVNCASIGCPNLARKAFRGANIAQQLDEAARAFNNHPRAVKVAKGQVQLSRIFSWFAKDFGTSEAKILAHIKGYADADLKAQLERVEGVSGYQYDWSLNEVRS